MNIQVMLQITQLIVAVLIIFVTAIQGKGSGIKNTIGSRSLYSTRRGAEKFIFRSTIVLGVLFAGLSVTSIFV